MNVCLYTLVCAAPEWHVRHTKDRVIASIHKCGFIQGGALIFYWQKSPWYKRRACVRFFVFTNVVR